MTEPDALEARCRAAGLRLTAARRALLAVLRQVQAPCDAPALLRLARPRHAELRLGTVYRFLRALERHALVQATSPRGRMHWRLNVDAAAGTAHPGDEALSAPMRAFLRDLEALGLAHRAPPADLPPGASEATLALLHRVAARLGYRLAPPPSPAY